MDPISLAISGIGLGLKLFGGMSSSSAQSAYSKQISALSQSNAQLEQQVNTQRQQAMELTGRRQQMEAYRNVQRARARGVNAAVNQGAQFGSGLAGGESQASAQGAWNASGVNQMMQISGNIFGLDNSISSNNAQISSLKSQMNSSISSDQGWANLGSSLMGGANTMSNLTKDAGSALSSMMNPLAGAFSF